MTDTTATITIDADLAHSLIVAIRVAADRGAYKLEEFGPVSAVVTQLAEAIEGKEIDTTE